jgi:hypothetical protein
MVHPNNPSSPPPPSMEPLSPAPTSTSTTANTLAKCTNNTDRTRESTQTSGACDEVDCGTGIVQPDIVKGHLPDTAIVKTKRPLPDSETHSSRQAKLIKFQSNEELKSSPVLPSSESRESLDANHPPSGYFPASLTAHGITSNCWFAIYGRLTEENQRVVFTCNVSESRTNVTGLPLG